MLRRHVVARCGLLFAAAFAAWLLSLPIAMALAGTAGTIASASAALVCVAAGFVALVVHALPLGDGMSAPQALLGMLARMMPPLMAALAVRFDGATLAEAGFLFWLIAFYLICLSVEVPLVLLGSNDVERSDAECRGRTLDVPASDIADAR